MHSSSQQGIIQFKLSTTPRLRTPVPRLLWSIQSMLAFSLFIIKNPFIFLGLSYVLPPITTTNTFSHLWSCSISVPLPGYLLPTLLMTKFYLSFKSKLKPTSSPKAFLITPIHQPLSLLTLWALYLSEARFPHLWTRHWWSSLWSPKSTAFIQLCIKIIEKEIRGITLKSISIDIINSI